MQEELERAVEDKEVEGWTLDEEHQDKAVMVKRGYGTLGGHALIALLTIWWTLGLGNVAYASYKYFGDADRMVLRAEDL